MFSQESQATPITDRSPAAIRLWPSSFVLALGFFYEAVIVVAERGVRAPHQSLSSPDRP